MSAPRVHIRYGGIHYRIRDGSVVKLPGNGSKNGSGAAKKNTVNAPCNACGSRTMATYWYDDAVSGEFSITLCSKCSRKHEIVNSEVIYR